ncbi:MAG: hypothetical protein V3V18_13705 [Methylococcales bacterium]
MPAAKLAVKFDAFNIVDPAGQEQVGFNTPVASATLKLPRPINIPEITNILNITFLQKSKNKFSLIISTSLINSFS